MICMEVFYSKKFLKFEMSISDILGLPVNIISSRRTFLFMSEKRHSSLEQRSTQDFRNFNFWFFEGTCKNDVIPKMTLDTTCLLDEVVHRLFFSSANNLLYKLILTNISQFVFEFMTCKLCEKSTSYLGKEKHVKMTRGKDVWPLDKFVLFVGWKKKLSD